MTADTAPGFAERYGPWAIVAETAVEVRTAVVDLAGPDAAAQVEAATSDLVDRAGGGRRGHRAPAVGAEPTPEGDS